MNDHFMDMKYDVEEGVETPDERFQELWELYGEGDASLENFGYDPDVNGLKKFANAFYELGVEDAEGFLDVWKKLPFNKWKELEGRHGI